MAAPSYLKGAEPISEPADLARHAFIGFARFGRAPVFEVTAADGTRTEITASCRVTTSSGMAIRGWVLAGAGIARFPDFAVAEDLAEGRLVRVLPDHVAGSPTLHAVNLPERFRPANVRRLLDFAQDYFRRRGS